VTGVGLSPKLPGVEPIAPNWTADYCIVGRYSALRWPFGPVQTFRHNAHAMVTAKEFPRSVHIGAGSALLPHSNSPCNGGVKDTASVKLDLLVETGRAEWFRARRHLLLRVLVLLRASTRCCCALHLDFERAAKSIAGGHAKPFFKSSVRWKIVWSVVSCAFLQFPAGRAVRQA